MRRFLVVVLAVLSVGMPPALLAKAPVDTTAVPPPDPDTQFPYTLALWDAVQGIPDGQSLRVRHAGPGIVEGFYTGHDDFDLTLEGYGLRTTVPLESIESISYERTHHLRAALIGGGIGLVAAVGVGLLIANAESDSDVQSDTGAVVLVSLGVGIPLGLALGALFGASETSWEEVYPPR